MYKIPGTHRRSFSVNGPAFLTSTSRASLFDIRYVERGAPSTKSHSLRERQTSRLIPRGAQVAPRNFNKRINCAKHSPGQANCERELLPVKLFWRSFRDGGEARRKWVRRMGIDSEWAAWCKWCMASCGLHNDCSRRDFSYFWGMFVPFGGFYALEASIWVAGNWDWSYFDTLMPWYLC